MKIFWLIIIWALLSSSVIGTFKEKKLHSTVIGTYSYVKYSPILVFIVLFPLWFFCGYRTDAIGDTRIYYNNYRDTPSEFKIPEFSGRFLFDLLQRFFKAYITDSPTTWLFFLCSIAVVLFCLVLSRYSMDLTTSLFYFFFAGSFIYFFNGARQLIAITICLFATKYLEEKKTFRFILMIIFASLFHSTACVMLLGLLFYKIKPWSKTAGIMCFGVSMIALLPSSVLTSLIGDIVEGTDYEQYAGLLDHDGVNIFRFFTVVVPSIFTYMYRDRIEKMDDPILNYCVNMSLVASLIYFVALFMTALVAVRVAEYFLTFNVLLYPYLFKIVLPENMRSYKFIFYIGYGIFFYYQMYITYGGLHYISAPLGIRV